MTEYGPKELDEAFKLLESADVLIGHHILGYDLPFLKSLYDVDLYDKGIVDTLVLSRLINPKQEGGHSLQAWGYRLKYPKIEHEDWSKYSKAMQYRCTSDVQLNFKVFRQLENTGRHFSDDSKKLEHDVAHIINEQMKNGWAFDTKKAELLWAKVNDDVGKTEDKVRETFKPKKFPLKVVTPKLKKDGELSKQGLREDEYNKILRSKDMKPFTRYYTQIFNLGSRAQIGIWLMDFGWKPTVFTPKGKPSRKQPRGNPQVDEDTLSAVDDIPEVSLILHYLTITKIRSFLDNWLSSVRDDGRIYGYVNPMGAITGRMSHSTPNLAQVPSSRSLYGPECRELFIVPKGYTLVGMDAKGLELRMLAHYMGDPNFMKTACEGDKSKGTDAHSLIQKMAKLNSRDDAKTLYYAVLYGSGDAKTGKIVGGTKRDGRLLKENLFAGLPELGTLIDKVQSAATRGYIKGLDGRLIRIRKAYSSLNALLQGGGAVVMKRALVILHKLATNAGLDFKLVGNIHDEFQSEVADKDVEAYSALGLQAMVLAGEYYNMNCPLEGDVSSGASWRETH
jgi:DNA polymerase I-like protein with 3'-5' exonuclease and polymerase domains